MFRHSSSSKSKGKKGDASSSRSRSATPDSLFQVLVSFHFHLHVLACLHWIGLFVIFYTYSHLQGAALTRQRQEQLIGCLQEQESQRTQEQEAPEQPTRGTDEVMRDAFGTSSDEDEDEHGGAQSSSHEDEDEQGNEQGAQSLASYRLFLHWS